MPGLKAHHRVAMSIVAIDNFFVLTPFDLCIIVQLQQFRDSPMSAPQITFEKFRDDMLAAGYEEVLERPWAPDAEVATHTHPFEANALVIQGEMWLTEQGGTARRLEAGDRFHLLVRLKVFNTEQMNQAVFAFRRYEDASLRYTGIESHPGLRHYGLYDTVVAR